MFMNDISIIVRHMRVFAERRMAEEGLGFPEQLVIMCLAASGTSNQERIASFLDIDKGAVAKTVAKLEAKGLVDGRTNEDNRREKILSLSPAGRHRPHGAELARHDQERGLACRDRTARAT